MRRRSDDGIIVGLGIQLSKATIMSDVTRILSAIEQGDVRVAEKLLPLVYDELNESPAETVLTQFWRSTSVPALRLKDDADLCRSCRITDRRRFWRLACGSRLVLKQATFLLL